MKRIKKAAQHIFRLLKNFFTKQNCCKCITICAIVFSQKSFAQNTTSSQTDSTTLSQSGLPKISNAQVKDLHGKTFSTSSFSNNGKPIIIVFWYSVHKFPTKELDALEENYEQWKKETGVKIIIISIDDSRTATNVLPMVNARGWDFEFYLDINSDFKRAMNVNLVPQTFLINGAGEIIWQTVGFMEGNESLIYDELNKIK